MSTEEEPRRLRIRGIHHITLISADLDRSVAFYQDTLGMRVVKRTRNADDPDARHFFFGDAVGTPGTVITCMEYPQMGEAQVGRGGTHHFALEVGSPEEVEGWRQYLQSRGVGCTEVLDRTYFKSIYLRDPDGHIVEIASSGPGFAVDEPAGELGGRMIEPR
jgi:glyoxylase I family protein